MLDHGVAPVGRDDADDCTFAAVDDVDMCFRHGTGVEGRDLVVVLVGHDHGLRGVAVVQLLHKARINVQRLQACQIGCAVLAHGRHGQRLAAQQLEAVGDIASTTTKIAAQRRHKKGHIQNV